MKILIIFSQKILDTELISAKLSPCPPPPPTAVPSIRYFSDVFPQKDTWKIYRHHPKKQAMYPCRLAPSNMMMLHGKVYRRILITCISNASSLYVRVKGELLIVRSEDLPNHI